MQESELTDKKLWENYWEEKPDAIGKKKPNLLFKEILRSFDQYLPDTKGLAILEIGGGQGEYLLYLTRHHNYLAHSLDYSKIGNQQTQDTFNRAVLPVVLYERDLFADNSDIPKFDIVFSLGLIEHFDNPEMVINKHLDLLKPGGILLLGVPNFSGIYQVALKRLAPSVTETHNMNTMNLDNWKFIEENLNTQKIFAGYIGGFEPLNMKKMEVKNTLNHIIYFFIKVLMVLFSFRMQFLRKYNSRFWSAYMIGVYRKM